MKKTLIVGDLHCKMSLVLPRILDVAISHCCDAVVLSGDLCDDWGVSGGAMVRQLEFTARWKREAAQLGIETVFLLGNHDSAYVGLPQYHFTKRDVLSRTGEILQEDLDVRIAVAVQGYLVTHAGLTASWARRNGLEFGCAADALAQQLCDMFVDLESRLRLAICGPRRGGWGDPGPLWADRRELIADPYGGCSQIVGHSPVESAVRWESDSGDALWFIDTLSLRSDGTPVGDATALIVCEGEVSSVPLFSKWDAAVETFCEGDAS